MLEIQIKMLPFFFWQNMLDFLVILILRLKYDFRPVIWACFDFRPCKKKVWIKSLQKKFYLKKVSGPTSQLIWHVVRHVAVVDCTTLVTWQAT